MTQQGPDFQANPPGQLWQSTTFVAEMQRNVWNEYVKTVVQPRRETWQAMQEQLGSTDPQYFQLFDRTSSVRTTWLYSRRVEDEASGRTFNMALTIQGDTLLKPDFIAASGLSLAAAVGRLQYLNEHPESTWADYSKTRVPAGAMLSDFPEFVRQLAAGIALLDARVQLTRYLPIHDPGFCRRLSALPRIVKLSPTAEQLKLAPSSDSPALFRPVHGVVEAIERIKGGLEIGLLQTPPHNAEATKKMVQQVLRRNLTWEIGSQFTQLAEVVRLLSGSWSGFRLVDESSQNGPADR